MVGSDAREDLTRAERARLHTGSDSGARTDTIMLMHVPKSGPTVLISIPRDSAVNIPGVEGKQKINAAFNKGPALLIQTIENNTGLRIDHYVEVGFGGFASVIDSIGGIQMCLPKAMNDDKAHINLPAGCQKLDGVNALGYVRSRHADGKNDFGRTERQRQMVGAVAKKAASPSTVLNPIRYYNVATKGVDALTVDKDMSLLDFVRFARGMKAISGSGGVALSVPTSDDNYQLCCNRGDAVKWDTKKATALFNAIKQDNTSGLKSS
jgi:LCP family protein required for cell wall assembly